MAQAPNLTPIEPEVKSKGKKLWLIIGAVVLLVLIGGGTFLLMGGSSSKTTEGAAAGSETAATTAEQPPEIAGLIAIKPFVVNLADTGTTRFLRIGMNLGCSDKKLTESYEKTPLVQAEIQDVLIGILTSKTAEQILSASGKSALKDELMKALNAKLGANAIKQIFFTEFLIQ